VHKLEDHRIVINRRLVHTGGDRGLAIQFCWLPILSVARGEIQ
jgi:hypothetical protein